MTYLMHALKSCSRRSRRHAAALLLVLASIVALAAPACTGSSDVASKLYATCSQNSDCNNGLICALGQCRPICKTIADCSGGGSCIFDSSGHAVCQSPAENNTSCDVVTAPCKPPLACASDFRCRNLCAADANCNVLGITGRVCATDATGTNYCADPQVPGEVDGGVITQPPPPGARDGGSTGPNDGAMGGRDGTTGSGDGPAVIPPIACVPACTQGSSCVNGACVACGMSGAACCSGMCAPGLSCSSTNNTCVCGGANQACCNGNTCNAGLSCNQNDAGPSLCACGTIGTACCPSADAGASMCSGTAVCAGIRCSCILEYWAGYDFPGSNTEGLVRRTDGTVWSSHPSASTVTAAEGAYVQVSNGSGPLRTSVTASSPQIAASTYLSEIGCAVVSGGVWCFPLGTTLTDSTFLGAGLGSTTPTSSPVQVVTAIGGPALANATQVVSGNGSGANFCAVTTDGSAWCWGYGGQGQLGHGDMANASYAGQVLTAASTPLTMVAEVRVGEESACARLTNGTVSCWGTNTHAELGVPYGTTLPALQQSLYAIPVTFLGTSGQRIATRLAAGPTNTHCAIMQDTSVVCWGYNGTDFTAGSTTTTPDGVGPNRVLIAAGGAALTGVIDLASDSNGRAMCAISGSTLALQCWGFGQTGARSATSPYPSAYQDISFTAVAGIRTSLSSSSYPGFGYDGLGYVDPTGVITFRRSPTTSQPPCTNLLP